MGHQWSAAGTRMRGWPFPWQLPVLIGWPRTIFMAIWTVVFAAACLLAALSSSLAVDRIQADRPELATGLVIRPDGTVFPVSTEARQSGIEPGESIVAIDGKSAASTVEELRRQLEGPAQSKLRIVARNTAGEQQSHVLTRDPHYRTSEIREAGISFGAFAAASAIISYFGLTIIPLVCGGLLMWRRARDPLAPWASLMMALMCIGMGGYPSQWLTQLPPPLPAVGMDLNALAFSSLLAVLAIFPSGRFESIRVAVFIAAAFVACFLTESLDPRYSNILFAGMMLVAIAFIVLRYRRMLGPGRQQIRWVLFGFGVSMVMLALLIVTQFLAGGARDYTTSVWSNLGGSFVGMLLSAVLMFGITFGLLRYRLYDADVAISRSVAYGTLMVALLAIFAGSERVIELLGEEYFGESLGALAGGLGAAIAAVMFVPLHHRLTRWAERRFQHGLTRLRTALPRLMGDLRATGSVDGVLEAALDCVNAGVHASRAVVLIDGDIAALRSIDSEQVDRWQSEWAPSPGEGLDCARNDPMFPLRIPLDADGHGRVGWLLLGPRPDGSFYGKDEREVLEEIADPLARAFVIATARAQREMAQAKQENAIKRELARFAKRLASIETLLARPTRLA